MGTVMSEVGVAMNGTKTVATMTLIVGGSIATGRATMTGVADDSMTTTISAMDTASDTFGTAVSGCHPPITHRGTSFVTTTLTSCRRLRMAAGGCAWTAT